jgi:excinuclease ABC subunit C
MNPNQAQLSQRIKKEVPQTIGVYLFKNENDQAIYIGKSVKLRNRMLSYFQQNSAKLETRIQQMIHNISDFTFQTTETEFLALLLEDSSIKKHKPFFNIKQQEYNEYQYLLLTNDPFPTIKMIDHFDEFTDGKIFGPFKDRYFADAILSIIHQYFHLRSCKESNPSNRCLSFELGICPGPCRDKISKQKYSQIVEQTENFLQGDTIIILQLLTKEMEKNADNLEFEKAKTQKEQFAFCKNFGKRQKFFDLFKTKNLVISDKNSETTYNFNKGMLTSHSIELNHSVDDRFILDRANIVYKWVHNNKNRCVYYFE